MLKLVVTIVSCIVIYVNGVMLGNILQQNHTKAVQVQMVQQVCDIAHRENSGYSERACGDVQDQTNTEYICNSTSCWVESL